MSSAAGGPIEPPPSAWTFPPIEDAPPDDLVAVGADLAPGTLLNAYRAGYFPMPLDKADVIGWWSPDPRGVIEPGRLHVSRSLRRSMSRYEIRVNTAFEEVLAGCADDSREHGWISASVRDAYLALHWLGWVHSVEAWDDDGLAGGLYGVSIGGLFAGESMFHRRTDASKVALAALTQILGPVRDCLLDVQWLTPHLARLGGIEVSRRTYAQRLATAVDQVGPSWSHLR